MNRRTMLYGGVAAVASLAGAGVAWWKFQPHEVAAQAENSEEAGAAEVVNAFWSLSFDTPDGKSLAMSSFRGKPLLVNHPHLGHSIPSVWYEVELKAPELHTTGVSLPG